MGSQSAMALPPAIADHSPVAACGAGELCEWLFPHLSGLYVEQVQPAGAGVVMQARSRAAGAACPACGAWSSRVHSGFIRTVADGPAVACGSAAGLVPACRLSGWRVVNELSAVPADTSRHR